MIFRQLFDATSGTYTYLLATRRGGEALIIDPVLEKVDRYLQLIARTRSQAGQGGRYASARRSHHRPRRAARPHALHHGDGRADRSVDVVSMRIADGDRLGSRASAWMSLYTPGHTDDCYSFLHAGPRVHRRHAADPRHRPHRLPERRPARAVRLDLQSPAASCRTRRMVFPAHDYKGDTVSTIGEESRSNPRLQVSRSTNMSS